MVLALHRYNELKYAVDFNYTDSLFISHFFQDFALQ